MNETISNFAIVTFLLTPLVGAYFLVEKEKFNSLFKKNWRRKQIGGLFLAILFASFMTVGIFAEPTEKQTEIESVEKKVEVNSVPESTAEESTQPIIEETQAETQKELFTVSSVIDGDTIELSTGKRVRYIGIDTPETKHPSKPVQCYGNEAYLKNKSLVEGKKVELEKDVSETDQYGRLLRYVYIDGVMVNELMVKEGYAKSSSYPPDIKYQDKFIQAEQDARNAEKGLWGDSCSVVQVTPNPTAVPVQQAPITNSGSCKYSCSSPDRDCSDFSSHSEAQAFFNCCGFTAQNDPMKLDSVGVGDGTACESI